jgi:hypothetical protein
MRHTLLFVIFFSGLCFAQSSETEVSYWSRGKSIAPWLYHTNKYVVTEVRYNLDQDHTFGVCLGKEIGSKKFSVVPEACAYTGRYHGWGPELWLLSETEKFEMWSYIQYAKFFDTSSFGYAWFQAERKIWRGLGIGPAAQFLKDGKDPLEADLGGSMKLSVGRWYFNIAPTWRVTKLDRGNPTLVTGVGFTF